MTEKLQQLKDRLQTIFDLQHAAALLMWDQQTYMPSGGAAGRGRQVALLHQMAQEKMIDEKLGYLLDDLLPYADQLPADSDDAALIRVTKRDYDKAVNVPPEFVARAGNHIATSYQAWTEARPKNDFASVEPHLQRSLDLSREFANFFPGYDHIADPLIDSSDYGMKAQTVKKIFADLREQLVPLVQAITSKGDVDNSCLHKHYPKAVQLDHCAALAKQYGYDFNTGRQDLTHHPFMIKLAAGDVRITTRVDENNLADCLFSVLHETGHALYEQGISRQYDGTPLFNGTSAGIHESQSRLWENMVGRSYGYWVYQYPFLQQAFPDQLNNVSLDEFYKAINRVQPSLIRTEADEVTYNLHVMIRFDFELEMLEGKLAVKDLPEAWHARYQSDLGVRAPNDINGCLQDVHWFDGFVGGAFQGYTLGNIMSALFYDQALQAHPEIPAQIENGQYSTLHSWLSDNLYTHGRKYTANELIEQVTGGSLTIDPYVSYLSNKYGNLYELS